MNYLDNVPEENYFKLSNGSIIRSMQELYDVVKNSDDIEFYSHVTNDKNDFANWVKYCIKDTILADKLFPVKDKNVFLGVIADEIAAIKLLQTPPIIQSTPVVQPEPIPDPTIAQATQPIQQTTPAIQSHPAAQPVQQPAPQSIIQPVITPDPTPQTIQQPTVQPIAQPIAQPVIQSIATPMEFEEVLKSLIDDIETEIITF